MNLTKVEQVGNLRKGDIILLTNGDLCEFQEMKQEYLIVKEKSYQIPVEMFQEVVNEFVEGVEGLRFGELFYINMSNVACFFRFVRLEDGNIIAENPLTNDLTRIPSNKYIGRVKDLI